MFLHYNVCQDYSLLLLAYILANYSSILMYTYERELTIQYYPNLNPNHKKGNKYRSRNPNSTTVISTSQKKWRIAALGLGLGFLR